MFGFQFSDKKKLVTQAMEVIDRCRTSVGHRSAYYRDISKMVETGRQDGSRAIISLLYTHIDRLASHLFSPTDLTFILDFENQYPKEILDKGREAARILTRDWERNNTDIQFGQGVFCALEYGSAILKQFVQQDAPDKPAQHMSTLLMPWQFGVYNEYLNDITRQPALCETTMLTLPEVWKRIWHLPEAENMFKRIKAHASRGSADEQNLSYIHQVLSTSPISTTPTTSQRPTPGGIVNIGSDSTYGTLGPMVDVDLIKMHELWAWDEEDYVTIQIIEPDILIAPLYKKGNLLAPGDIKHGLQPYRLIQPNMQQGYFWGRSEVADLVEPQQFLATTMDDAKRLWGLQVDRLLAFEGYDGIDDEAYDQFRGNGYIAGNLGTKVQDLTPPFPSMTLQLIEFIEQQIDKIGGFDNILSGGGEPGVRAGNHAETLMKSASPRLRDRSLLVERQCASAADLRMRLMMIKDGSYYWTDPDKIEETKFLLHDLPDDLRVAVDSHSSSPIFMDNHQQLTMAGVKVGAIDKHSFIELMPFPQKDLLQRRLSDNEKAAAKQAEELKKTDPEAWAKALTKGHK